MQINRINSINFNGMWEPVKVLHKESGIYHLNKQMFTLYDMVYHPWVDEKKEDIQKEVDKHFIGRSFCVMDTGLEDSHFKASVYEMNRVRVGNAIKHKDKAKLLKQGYEENLHIGIPDDEEFREIYYNNESHSAYDVHKMDTKRITELANMYFPQA